MAREIKLASFHYLKVSGERKEDFSGELKITPNINIKSIEKFDSDKKQGKQDILKVEFGFEVNYSDLGKVSLEGLLFLIVDSKTLKEAVEGWKAKKLDSEIHSVILNTIMQKASLKSIELEEEVGLPCHIQIPRLQLDKQK